MAKALDELLAAIVARRRALKMTTAELAKRSGYAVRTIERLQAGHRTTALADVLQALQLTTGITPMNAQTYQSVMAMTAATIEASPRHKAALRLAYARGDGLGAAEVVQDAVIEACTALHLPPESPAAVNAAGEKYSCDPATLAAIQALADTCARCSQ